MAEDGEVQQFGKIYIGKTEGVFLLSASGIRWKSTSTDSFKKILKDDIRSAIWTPVGQRATLRLTVQGKEPVRFDSFNNRDRDVVEKLLGAHFDLKLKVRDLSAKGNNWGEMEVVDKHLVFKVDGQTALEVPLSSISQCALPGKNEVEIQFHEDASASKDEDCLMEMRVYVPPGEEETTGAEYFQQAVLDRADIRSEAGQCIVELDETIGTFLTPRGRYVIEMFGSFFRMHGKTYDYKILYRSINRLFLLAKPDRYHVALVISLEEPIRQGKQVYQHLVMQMAKDEVDLPVHLSEEVIKEKYEGALSPMMSGMLPDVVAKVFKALSQKKVFIPGNFKTANGDSAVKCALKASEGFLYPLEKSFLFIHKPVTFIRFEDVNFVEFQRYSGQGGGSTRRNFDLHIACKSVGGDPGKEYNFSAIDRREYQPLLTFLKTRKSLRIKNLSMAEEQTNERGSVNYRHDPYKAALGEGGGEESDEEDSDFEVGSESSSSSEDEESEVDEFDSGSEKKKKKEKKRRKGDKKGSKSKKRKKDPNAPKKAMTAYLLYATATREKVKEENPDLSFGDLSKKISSLWKELSDQDKEKWIEKEKEDKERYDKEMTEYKDRAPADKDKDEEDSGDDDDGESEEEEEAADSEEEGSGSD